MPIHRQFAAPVLAVALLVMPARAEWPPTGVPLCNGCGADAFWVISDGAGGAFVLWRQLNSGTATDVYLQRVTADGTIAAGWSADGLPVCVQPFDQDPWGLIADGQGGVIALWDDRRTPGIPPDLYTQRVQADGTLAPGWLPNGVRVCDGPGTEGDAGLAADGLGGAFIAWEDDRIEVDAYAQHILGDGTRAPGWPSDGVPICTLAGEQGGPVGVVPDEAGGAYVIWWDGRRGGFPAIDLYAQRIDASGAIPPGWAEGGVLVMQWKRMVGNGTAVPDGTGGFVVAAAQIDSLTLDHTYWAQRFLGTGMPAPGWPADGILVCGASNARDHLFGARDRSGGLLLSWHDYRPPPTGGEIYAARLLPGGGFAPGWMPDGNRVSDDTGPGVESRSAIAPDGLGGAYVVWIHGTDFGQPSYVQHLDPSGAVAPGWPAFGHRVSPTTTQLDTRVSDDGQGGAIVVWRGPGPDRRQGAFAQRFGPDGPTPTLVSLVSVAAEPDRVVLVWHGAGPENTATVYRRGAGDAWRALGAPARESADRLRYEDGTVVAGERYGYRLGYVAEGGEQFTSETWVDVPTAHALALAGFVPNPAIGPPTVRFSLSHAGPATLELLDIAGRRIASREVGTLGPGRHVIRFDEGPRFSPGIYLVRLRTPGRTLVTRAAVLR